MPPHAAHLARSMSVGGLSWQSLHPFSLLTNQHCLATMSSTIEDELRTPELGLGGRICSAILSDTRYGM